MNRDRIENLLRSVAAGTTDVADAMHQLHDLPFTDLEFAKLDTHRSLRQGIPEVIFAPGKSKEQIARIASELKAKHDLILATRVEENVAEYLSSLAEPGAYHKVARVFSWGEFPEPANPQVYAALLAAGTSDLPVAEEARVVLRAHGYRVETIYDVGVAGLHRVLAHRDTIRQSSVAIVVAGMDGALPSVVGGLIQGPVIAVPTSIGYGASFQGLAALLSMLNSCAAGLTVVNIDNGFGAAVAAIRILQ